MKIVLLQDDFPPLAKGGAGVVVCSLAQEYVRQGHDVVVITAVQDRGSAQPCVVDGICVEPVYSNYHMRWRAWRSLYNPSSASRVRRLLAQHSPDVVHAHNVHTHLSYFSLVLARRTGAKVILTAHDVMSFNCGKLINYTTYRVSAWRQFREQRFRYNPFRNSVIRYVLKRYVHKVVAVSNALRDALQANGIGNVSVIHNGINPEQWEVSREHVDEFKKRHNIGNSAVLFSGGATAQKGSQQLLDAMSCVVEQIPDAQLLIIGRQVVERPFAVSTGWITGTELACAYHAAAVVAVPSICFDSFPTINLEAMACSKPVVATHLGGSREAVLDGETGYILDPLDVKLFADTLTTLLMNKELPRVLGARGQTRVQTFFTLPLQAQLYCELFDTL